MPATEVQQFIDALEQIESSRQYDAMVALFAEDSNLETSSCPITSTVRTGEQVLAGLPE
jgi:hypothetical protein